MIKNKIRFFNTTGPCNPQDHYMLPPEDRLVGAQLKRYIEDKLYWVLHAPRQTGKTTFLHSWMKEINSKDEAIACYVSLERCQGIEEPQKAIAEICEAIKITAQKYGLPVPNVNTNLPNSMLNEILFNWAKIISPKPLVVLFDEVDVLVGDAMISFLRQMRDGFATRGVGLFPTSIALVGMRDLKDYITMAKDGKPVNPGSPFNIKADSAVLGNFHKDDIGKLFAQRAQETGQKITQEALDFVYEQSKGQPWLVNSLFMRATLRILNEDSKETVTIEHIKQAREQMILARETHLDALAYRLQDERIKKVIETLMTGKPDIALAQSEGFRLCIDLGLVSLEGGTPQVSNPIYREVLAREITYGMQYAIVKPEWKWEKDDGTLDMDTLLQEFQKFWRANADIWEQQSDYIEAFPHLLLQAFLQRVLNGGGHIDREYAAGRGRMDLRVEYKEKSYIIEVKMIRDYNNFEIVKEEGLKQIKKYRDSVAPQAPSYLLIFDRRTESKKASWQERISWTDTDGIAVLG
ncbi:MAG: PD-(D/E)XK nuclease domain-containing protein, partial [Elusimicrobiota bacterium]|nr:PD-(D/E)XK nuclease domain-containing protein [Elusimicrobiota bacterium]